MTDDEETAGYVERLLALDTCAVSDALDRLGLTGATSGFRAVGGGDVRVSAPVATVRLEPDDGHRRGRHLGSRTLDGLPPGTAVVVANAGRVASACWGGLLTLALHGRRGAAVVCDGAVRDVDEMVELGVPVYARSVNPRTARGRYVEVEAGGPVEIGEHSVRPGDLLLADRSGIVFVSAGGAEEIVALAEEIAAREGRMADRLRAGARPSEVLGGDYEELSRGRG